MKQVVKIIVFQPDHKTNIPLSTRFHEYIKTTSVIAIP